MQLMPRVPRAPTILAAMSLLAAHLLALGAPVPLPAAAAVLRSRADYQVPPLRLVRADGRSVSLDQELARPGALVLNFVFTSCSAICPVMSRTFAELQQRAPPSLSLQLVSISLDPLNDTPAVLRQYGKQFGAGPNWRFYTGTADASIAAQRAFDLYRGDKMNHLPLTLVRRAPGQPWIRLEGYVGAADLLRELGPATAKIR